jgi:glycosyltransferase involved in cell wall biosynthesis
MRVAYVCADPGVPVFGPKGSSVHVQEVVRELVRRGVDVSLWCARMGGEPPPDLEGVGVRCVGAPTGRDAAGREAALQASDEDLVGMLDHDVVDLVYERYSLWGTAGMRHAASAGVPGVLEVNAPLIDEQARHRSLADRGEAERRARIAMSLARVVVCVSEPVAAWVSEVAPRARTSVVTNGVDPARFTPTPEPLGPFTVGFVGTLKPWHGVDTLVRAVAQIQGVRLRVVGDGPERASLEALAAELDAADRVDFVGTVPPAALPSEMARLHAAAAPYPAAEGYFSPLKVFEYLAAGLPVIASRSGQVAGLIEDGVTGLLTQPGDALDLAAAIVRLRAQPHVRAGMRRAARHTALSHTWSSAVDASLAAAGVPLGNRPVRRVAV